MQLTHETFDMMILATPYIVVVMAIVALLLFVFRCHKSAVALTFVTLLLNGLTEQVPLRMKRDVPTVKPAGTLRVLEYNVCGKVEYAPIHGSAEFLQFFDDTDADFVFLPENTIGVTTLLEAKMQQDYPYSLHQFPEFEAVARSYADFTLYSRFPLSDYKNYKVDYKQLLIEHPYLDSLSVVQLGTHFMAYEATADVNGQPVTLLHVHMRSNTYDTAMANGNGRRQQASNIYERLQIGYAYRELEAKVIRDSLRNCPNPLLICGDFNDVCGSHSLRIIQDCRRNNVHSWHRDRLSDAWWEGGQGFGFTYVDQHLYLRLDHILYSRDFLLQAVSVPDVPPFSDHLPLIADFLLDPLTEP